MALDNLSGRGPARPIMAGIAVLSDEAVVRPFFGGALDYAEGKGAEA